MGTTVYGTVTTNPNGDITKVFGEGTPQWNEARFSQTSPSGTADRALAQTDFVGFSIHCALDSPTCASGQADVLPEEPGGYSDFKALHGAQAIDQFLTGGTTVTGLDGKAVLDPFKQPGFPGFDGMSAAASLAYAAEMQESGVPVTFAYISDAHDNHGVAGNTHVAYGPGEAGYVQQLKDYDKAFGDFFTRLANDGINKDNTLFVFTVEEGDHFAGTAPDDPCDGVTTACTYANGHVTEVNGDLKRLVATY